MSRVMSPYTAEMAYAAVERGAQWLDTRCPDWFEKIDLNKLNLANGDNCVLGQTAPCIVGPPPNDPLTSGYWRVVRRFGKCRDEWAEKRGFLGFYVDGAPFGEGRVTFEMLTIAWRRYIRRRLEAASKGAVK